MGREGVDIAATVKTGLILPDIHLPVMDRYATARELRKNPELA
jgi:CheY-like chemotaxis protein